MGEESLQVRYLSWLRGRRDASGERPLASLLFVMKEKRCRRQLGWRLRFPDNHHAVSGCSDSEFGMTEYLGLAKIAEHQQVRYLRSNRLATAAWQQSCGHTRSICRPNVRTYTIFLPFAGLLDRAFFLQPRFLNTTQNDAQYHQLLSARLATATMP